MFSNQKMNANFHNTNNSSGFDSLASAWEQSLDEIVHLADQNLAALERTKKSTKVADTVPASKSSSAHASKHTYRTEYRQNLPPDSPDLYDVRSGHNDHDGDNFGGFGSPRHGGTNNDHHGFSHLYGNLEKKLDAFMKKSKIHEFKIKSLENDHAIYQKDLREKDKHINTLLEAQKTDKRIVSSLQKELASIKTKVDAFGQTRTVSSSSSSSIPFAEDHSNGANHGNVHSAVEENKSSSLTASEIASIIDKKMQSEFSKVLEEVISACAKEQACFLSQLTERNPLLLTGSSRGSYSKGGGSGGGLNRASILANLGQMSSVSAGTETVGATFHKRFEQQLELEKDVVRLKSEVERLKSRQSSLATVYTDLRDGVNAREQRAEDNHKRVMSKHRMEMDVLVNSVSKRINDAIGHMQLQMEGRTDSLEKAVASHIEGTGRTVSELHGTIKQLQQDKQSVEQEVESIRESNAMSASRISAAETLIKNLISQTAKFSQLGSAVDQQEENIAELRETMKALDFQSRAALQGLDEHASYLDDISKAIDTVNIKYQARCDALGKQVVEQQTSTQQALNDINQNRDEMRRQLSETAELAKIGADTRGSVDSVLRDIDARAQDDASWSYQFRTAAQKLDYRLSALEANHKNTRTDILSDFERLEAAVKELRVTADSTIGDKFRQEMRERLTAELTRMQRDLSDRSARTVASMEQRCAETVLAITKGDQIESLTKMEGRLSDLQKVQTETQAQLQTLTMTALASTSIGHLRKDRGNDHDEAQGQEERERGQRGKGSVEAEPEDLRRSRSRSHDTDIRFLLSEIARLDNASSQLKKELQLLQNPLSHTPEPLLTRSSTTPLNSGRNFSRSNWSGSEEHFQPPQQRKQSAASWQPNATSEGVEGKYKGKQKKYEEDRIREGRKNSIQGWLEGERQQEQMNLTAAVLPFTIPVHSLEELAAADPNSIFSSPDVASKASSSPSSRAFSPSSPIVFDAATGAPLLPDDDCNGSDGACIAGGGGGGVGGGVNVPSGRLVSVIERPRVDHSREEDIEGEEERSGRGERDSAVLGMHLRSQHPSDDEIPNEGEGREIAAIRADTVIFSTASSSGRSSDSKSRSIHVGSIVPRGRAEAVREGNKRNVDNDINVSDTVSGTVSMSESSSSISTRFTAKGGRDDCNAPQHLGGKETKDRAAATAKKNTKDGKKVMEEGLDNDRKMGGKRVRTELSKREDSSFLDDDDADADDGDRSYPGSVHYYPIDDDRNIDDFAEKELLLDRSMRNKPVLAARFNSKEPSPAGALTQSNSSSSSSRGRSSKENTRRAETAKKEQQQPPPPRRAYSADVSSTRKESSRVHGRSPATTLSSAPSASAAVLLLHEGTDKAASPAESGPRSGASAVVVDEDGPGNGNDVMSTRMPVLRRSARSLDNMSPSSTFSSASPSAISPLGRRKGSGSGIGETRSWKGGGGGGRSAPQSPLHRAAVGEKVFYSHAPAAPAAAVDRDDQDLKLENLAAVERSEPNKLGLSPTLTVDPVVDVATTAAVVRGKVSPRHGAEAVGKNDEELEKEEDISHTEKIEQGESQMEEEQQEEGGGGDMRERKKEMEMLAMQKQIAVLCLQQKKAHHRKMFQKSIGLGK